MKKKKVIIHDKPKRDECVKRIREREKREKWGLKYNQCEIYKKKKVEKRNDGQKKERIRHKRLMG
jgi:hypothetical protein